jgi:hypothetical protein
MNDLIWILSEVDVVVSSCFHGLVHTICKVYWIDGPARGKNFGCCSQVSSPLGYRFLRMHFATTVRYHLGYHLRKFGNKTGEKRFWYLVTLMHPLIPVI